MARTRRSNRRKRTNRTAKEANTKHRPNSRRVERPYPRVTMQEALRVPQVLKEKNGGNPWSPDEVAKAVDLKRTNNRFFYMAAASRDFGFTEGGRDSKQVELTDFGRELVYAPSPEVEHQLMVQGFRNIDVFRRVVEYYKGSNLPEMKYLGNTLDKEFGLHPEIHEEFSTLFRENCDYLARLTGQGLNVLSGLPDAARHLPSRDAVDHSPEVVTLAEPETDTGLLGFVIMPFRERETSHAEGFFDEVLKSLIAPAGRKAGFRIITANRRGSDVIQSTIVNNLLTANLVIADLTEHNPNVLFEL